MIDTTNIAIVTISKVVFKGNIKGNIATKLELATPHIADAIAENFGESQLIFFIRSFIFFQFFKETLIANCFTGCASSYSPLLTVTGILFLFSIFFFSIIAFHCTDKNGIYKNSMPAI